MNKRGEGEGNIPKIVVVIAVVLVLLLGVPTKLWTGTKMALSWLGVIDTYEILDVEHVSIIDVKKSGQIFAYDPNDWRSGDGSVDCEDDKAYITLVFDRSIDESTLPGSFKLYKEKPSCRQGTSKESDFMLLNANYELENKGLGTKLTIGPFDCGGCGFWGWGDLSEWNYIIRFEYETKNGVLQGKLRSEDGKPLNPGTGMVKFNAG